MIGLDVVGLWVEGLWVVGFAVPEEVVGLADVGGADIGLLKGIWLGMEVGLIVVCLVIVGLLVMGCLAGLIIRKKIGRNHLQRLDRILPRNGQVIIATSFFHESLDNANEHKSAMLH